MARFYRQGRWASWSLCIECGRTRRIFFTANLGNLTSPDGGCLDSREICDSNYLEINPAIFFKDCV
jgi:hypothetical protein